MIQIMIRVTKGDWLLSIGAICDYASDNFIMVIKMLNTWAGDKADKQLKGEPGVTYALKTNKVFFVNISGNTYIFVHIRFILTFQYHSSDILSLDFQTEFNKYLLWIPLQIYIQLYIYLYVKIFLHHIKVFMV